VVEVFRTRAAVRSRLTGFLEGAGAGHQVAVQLRRLVTPGLAREYDNPGKPCSAIRLEPGVKAAVKIGVELVAQRAQTLAPGAYIETWLTLNEKTIEKSSGRDEYLVSTFLVPGRRMAATARLNISQFTFSDRGLSPLQVRPAWPIYLLRQKNESVYLQVKTNVFNDPGELRQRVTLRIVGADGRPVVEIPLSRPRLEINWLGVGRFSINITPFLGS